MNPMIKTFATYHREWAAQDRIATCLVVSSLVISIACIVILFVLSL